MKEAIKQQNLSNEFYTPEKCYITELSNMSDDPDTSIARARVETGDWSNNSLASPYRNRRALLHRQWQGSYGGWETTATGSKCW
jgi:hypothetical protein